MILTPDSLSLAISEQQIVNERGGQRQRGHASEIIHCPFPHQLPHRAQAHVSQTLHLTSTHQPPGRGRPADVGVVRANPHHRHQLPKVLQTPGIRDHKGGTQLLLQVAGGVEVVLCHPVPFGLQGQLVRRQAADFGVAVGTVSQQEVDEWHALLTRHPLEDDVQGAVVQVLNPSQQDAGVVPHQPLHHAQLLVADGPGQGGVGLRHARHAGMPATQ